MREMLLAAAVCGAFGLAVASFRMRGGDAYLADAPSADAEVKATLSMAGAPYMVINGNGDAARPGKEQP